MDDVSFRYSLDIGMKKKLKNFILKIGKMADQVGYVSENPNLVTPKIQSAENEQIGANPEFNNYYFEEMKNLLIHNCFGSHNYPPTSNLTLQRALNHF